MIQVNKLDSRNQSCIQNFVSDKFNDNSKFQKKREATG